MINNNNNHNNNNNDSNNKSTFSNLRSFFTIRNFIKLALTLILSYYLRSYIITLLDLDYSALEDFFLIGIIVSFILKVFSVCENFSVFSVEHLEGKGKAQQEAFKQASRNPEIIRRDSTRNSLDILPNRSYNPNSVNGSSVNSSSCKRTSEYLLPNRSYNPNANSQVYDKSNIRSSLYNASSVGSNVTSQSVPIKYIPSRYSSVYKPLYIKYAPSLQTPTPTLGVNSIHLPKAPISSNLTTPNTGSPLLTPTQVNSGLSKSALKYTPSHCLDGSKSLIQPSTQNTSSTRLFPTSPSSIDTNGEFSRRRDIISKEIKTKLDTTYSNKEVVIAKKGLFGKVKLGFKSLGTDLTSIYIKYDSITRRKLL